MATFFISSQSILLSPLFCVVLFGIFLFEIKIQIKASEQDFDMASNFECLTSQVPDSIDCKRS